MLRNLELLSISRYVMSRNLDISTVSNNLSRINQMTKIFETVDISRFLHITYLEILRSSRSLNIMYLKM